MEFYLVLNNFRKVLLLPYYEYSFSRRFNNSYTVEGSIISSENPFPFYNMVNITNICTLVKIINNFEYHYLQNDFYLKYNLNQMLVILLFYLNLLLIELLLLMLLLFYLIQYCL